MLPGRSLLDYTNLFPPKDCKKKDKQYLRILKINMVAEASVEVELKNRWSQKFSFRRNKS